MGTSRRHILLATLLAALIALAFVSGCGQSTQKDTTTQSENKEPIKAGAVVSLTGNYAGLGEPERNTLEMEQKRINDAGGIVGIGGTFTFSATDHNGLTEKDIVMYEIKDGT